MWLARLIVAVLLLVGLASPAIAELIHVAPLPISTIRKRVIGGDEGGGGVQTVCTSPRSSSQCSGACSGGLASRFDIEATCECVSSLNKTCCSICTFYLEGVEAGKSCLSSYSVCPGGVPPE